MNNTPHPSTSLNKSRKNTFFEWSPPWNSDIVSDIPSGSIFVVYMAYLFWQSIWHSFWRILWIALTFFLTFYLASIWHAFWHTFWHYFWHSIWHLFWHSIWHLLRHSFWHLFWHSLTFFLVFYLASILTCFLAFYVTFSLASGWGPAAPTETWRPRLGPVVLTEIWSSWLRSGSPHWDLALAV